MALPLWSNSMVNLKAVYLRTVLNTGHSLRLFANNFVPDPSTPLASFTEATFTGYAAIDLTGAFTGPAFVQNGQYELQGGVFAWTNSGATTQTVYGWYIDDGTVMDACQLFDVPFVMAPNVTLAFALRPQEISQSVLP